MPLFYAFLMFSLYFGTILKISGKLNNHIAQRRRKQFLGKRFKNKRLKLSKKIVENVSKVRTAQK